MATNVYNYEEGNLLTAQSLIWSPRAHGARLMNHEAYMLVYKWSRAWSQPTKQPTDPREGLISSVKKLTSIRLVQFLVQKNASFSKQLQQCFFRENLAITGTTWGQPQDIFETWALSWDVLGRHGHYFGATFRDYPFLSYSIWVSPGCFL